ncbi:hypothetical protein ACWT_3756 [Actinoplanes sp. SE50]|nr:hypothetical protein ACPL_3884 [Actinoplanes sp. SE50/110]ATO83171.1 hypothetical protein ACWT_3756 [Actinoplanes sp. SE50]SLM00578.1 hypothetical protein ACSP50_3811 [Actinoplanes sp. SE50/110]
MPDQARRERWPGAVRGNGYRGVVPGARLADQRSSTRPNFQMAIASSPVRAQTGQSMDDLIKELTLLMADPP